MRVRVMAQSGTAAAAIVRCNTLAPATSSGWGRPTQSAPLRSKAEASS